MKGNHIVLHRILLCMQPHNALSILVCTYCATKRRSKMAVSKIQLGHVGRSPTPKFSPQRIMRCSQHTNSLMTLMKTWEGRSPYDTMFQSIKARRPARTARVGSMRHHVGSERGWLAPTGRIGVSPG